MMAKNIPKMPLPKLDDLFTTEEERTNDKLEKVIDIKISDIDDFPDHPFKVIENEDMFNMRDVEVDLVTAPGLVLQLPVGAQDVHGGAHRPPRDMAVVDGQDGVGGHPHVVDQGLAGGAEHLRDAPGGPVEKFKGLVTIHVPCFSFPRRFR